MKSKVRVKKSIAVSLAIILGLSVTIFITMLLFNVTDYGITIASFGATIFMIFAHKIQKRKIIGAYTMATVFGIIFSKLPAILSLKVALAVVLSVIAMTIFAFQHAPAIGMAIAIVLNNFPFWTDVFVLTCLLFIISMTFILKEVLRNPSKVMNFIDIEEEKIKWKLRKRAYPKYISIK